MNDAVIYGTDPTVLSQQMVTEVRGIEVEQGCSCIYTKGRTTLAGCNAHDSKNCTHLSLDEVFCDMLYGGE